MKAHHLTKRLSKLSEEKLLGIAKEIELTESEMVRLKASGFEGLTSLIEKVIEDDL